MRRFLWALLGVTLVATLFVGCKRHPATVTVSPEKAELVGKDPTVTFKAQAKDSKGRPIPEATFSWRSSDEKIAIVEPTGKVTGRGTGTATISATSEKATGTGSVKVTWVESITLKVPDSGFTGPPGTHIPVAVKVGDERRRDIKDVAVTWASSDPAVATVDERGVVALLAPGMVTISASVGKARGEVSQEVVIQLPKFLRLPNTAVFVRPEETAQLEFEVFDKKGVSLDIFPTFTSSNPEVVTVDAKGVATGVAPGTADVIVSTGPESRPIHITVK